MATAPPGELTATRPPLPRLPAVAWRGVLPAVIVLTAVLTALSPRYGYHRDELYFRMLDPAWGYVDQPPLTPLIVHGLTAISDSLVVLRIPATLSLLAAVVATALLARELGGGHRAQTLTAWGFGTGATPLLFAHTLLTASIDMAVWAVVAWLVTRALLRDPRAWILVGVVAALGTYNRLLVGVLLVAVLAGIVVAGPRAALTTRWPCLGALAAVVVGLPNVLYQALHAWPQLAMGAALAQDNADDVRVDMWWFQLVVLGPGMLLVWAPGLVALWRRPQWRPLRSLVVAYPILLAFTFVGGAQIYYAWGITGAFLAAGVVAWRHTARSLAALVVFNALGSALISLPLVSASTLGSTPIGAVNQTARDAVGWPTYVRQVEAVVDTLSPADRARAVILTANYGQAGALDRFGTDLPPVHSGHNALGAAGSPRQEATVAVVVTDDADGSARWFATCEIAARLDNEVGVDNEEQGVAVQVCRDPRGGWAALWPHVTHLD